MDEPLTWALIWVVVAVVFALGELTSPGAFFMAPFAIGGLAAAIPAFLGAPVLFGWFVFLIVSVISFLGLRPLARRLDESVPLQAGIGAHRLIGETATVLEAIPAPTGLTGLVRTGGEQWKADSDHGTAFGPGEQVRIVEVRGTSVIVEPLI